jgi:hypothetical protein
MRRGVLRTPAAAPTIPACVLSRPTGTAGRPVSPDGHDGGGSDMADVLFAVVTIVSFALLILFIYGCEKA